MVAARPEAAEEAVSSAAGTALAVKAAAGATVVAAAEVAEAWGEVGAAALGEVQWEMEVERAVVVALGMVEEVMVERMVVVTAVEEAAAAEVGSVGNGCLHTCNHSRADTRLQSTNPHTSL